MRALDFARAALALFLALSATSSAKYVDMEFSTKRSWDFATKFVLQPNPHLQDIATFTIDAESGNSNAYLVFYIEGDETFSKALHFDGTPEERCASPLALKKVKILPGAVQSMNLNISNVHGSVPAAVYVAVSSCISNFTAPLAIDFLGTFLQSDGSQFGYNLQGLLAMYVVFFVLQAVILTVYGLLRYKSRINAVHPFFVVSVSFMSMITVGSFSLMVHFLSYRNDGMGTPFMEGLGDMCLGLCMLFTISSLLALSSGHMITGEQHPRVARGRSMLQIITLIEAVLFLSCYVVGKGEESQATYIYFFSTAPGIIIVVLFAFLGAAIGFTALFTYKRQAGSQAKRSLLLVGSFGVCFALWLPISVGLAEGVGPWRRQLFVATSLEILLTITAMLLVFICRPQSRLLSLPQRRTDREIERDATPYETL